ncbi:hypothetical protein BpHYR1_019762 [Brachionus plicatilis]|uniref:Uncharacterized protein n=1 Tax=Brachionus plicatilis TaxID=10195 RepID=A0A3M7PQH5_BRAPC|nr:hypothetical protein BpHYR1_019762 [Brachionus plicatilis]
MALNWFFCIGQHPTMSLVLVYPGNPPQASSVKGVKAFPVKFTHPPTFTSVHQCCFYYTVAYN